ncbi:MAG: spore cortex biosynthesis protein YabQ [Candidatus Ventricola sp.]
MAGASGEMTVADQARVFLAMALCGVLLGAAYDALAPLRKGPLTVAADLLFGALCALGMIAVALRMEAEPLRLYAFAGVLAGGALYLATIGTIVRKMSEYVRNWRKKRRKMDKKAENAAGE